MVGGVPLVFSRGSSCCDSPKPPRRPSMTTLVRAGRGGDDLPRMVAPLPVRMTQLVPGESDRRVLTIPGRLCAAETPLLELAVGSPRYTFEGSNKRGLRCLTCIWRTPPTSFTSF